MWDLFLCFIAYLLGCLPTGRLIAQIRGIDITASGSGNSGATNVARVVGKGAGLATLLIDSGKGVLAVWLGSSLTDSATLDFWCGLVVVLGHCYSLPLIGLFGGKGVATALGVVVATSWPLAIIALIIFAGAFYLSRIVSASSLSAACCLPLVSLMVPGLTYLFPLLASLALVIVIRHRANIRRLVEGSEPRFRSASGAKAPTPVSS